MSLQSGQMIAHYQLLEKLGEGGMAAIWKALDTSPDREVAETLEAAHENHVIHRNLKPANIQVAPDGHVKVPDFGLAKAFETGSPVVSGETSLSPTDTAALRSRLRSADWLPDGRQFVLLRGDDERPPGEIRIVINWIEELKARTGSF